MRVRLLASAILGVSLAAPALADTLTFPDGICSVNADGSGAMTACVSFSHVNQAHGDIAGVLDVKYENANTVTHLESLQWWGAGYNNLPNAVFAGGGDSNSFARITLTPQSGQTISLNGFDLGAYLHTTLGTHVRVWAVGGNSYSFTGKVGELPADIATHFSFGDISSSEAIVIEYQNSAYNVGINNIEYTVGAVPEPETYAMLLVGLTALGWLRRRRV